MSIESTTPLLHYFESGNIFSGSDRKKRYKIFPDKEGNMLCKLWFGNLCLEKTDPEGVSENTFPVTEEGRSEMIRWLTEATPISEKNVP